MSCDGPDCEKALQSLYEFLDQELDGASCAQIQAHLDDCADCLTEYQLEQVVKALVSRSCHETAPPPLREKVLWRIRSVQVEIRAETQG